MALIFGTSNQNKVDELKRILNVELESTSVEVEEIQSLDTIKVVKYKALGFFTQLKKPLIVEDTALKFNALNGLPGTYINDFAKAIGNTGLLELLTNKKDRSAVAEVNICLILDENNLVTFTGITAGTISLKEEGTNGFGWDTIFIPDGSNKTFAQMENSEKDSFSMRSKALLKLKEYLATNQILLN